MPSDLELAFDTIKAKRPRYDLLFSYYDGAHPLVYSASRLREIFRHIDASFTENWCAVVVNSVIERIHIDRFTVAGNDAAGERLARIWLDTGLALDSYDAHLCALVTGEAAIVVGRDPNGNIEAYYNDSRLIHVQYDSARPRVVRFAAKLWDETDEEGKRVWRMTLYYPDRLEHYFARKDEMPDNGRGFTLEYSEPNEFGVIPIFHLTRERRALSSELQNVIAPQNQLNKLLADMMVAAEFGAFKQRYLISQADTKEPLKNSPGLVWSIPASDGQGQNTEVGELTATDLDNYIAALDRSANVIAAISRTPKHYFFQSGDVPSGESLKAMESPLTKKVERYAERFEPTWRAIGAFLLALDGAAQLQPNDLDVVWREAQTDTPLTEAQTVQAYVNAGMPLVTALRKHGWSETELAQLEDDLEAEQAGRATLADALMANAERNFSQNGNNQERTIA
jgi:hypothetical protein